ncbi:MAG: plastocyanin/azurin family copper-binding protein [Actinomycetota bacterium]
MSRGGRIISTIVLGAALLLAPASLTPAWASGGGGCGRSVSDAQGTSVAIKQFCFLPTVLHVEPGDSVTFTNRDHFDHNVQGASVSWGSWDPVRLHTPVTYRFIRSGVYPYVCSFHPGMVGAVVVGNGNGPGGAGVTTTERGPVIKVEPVRANLGPAPATGDDGGTPWPLVVFVGIGLFAVAGIALLQLRQQFTS